MSPSSPILWSTLLLISVAAAALVAGVGVALVNWRAERRRQRVVGRMSGGEEVEEGEAPVFREETEREGPLDKLAALSPRLGNLERLLQQAGLTWSGGQYLLYTLASAVSLGVVAHLFAGIPFLTLTVATFGASLPYLWVQRKKAKRLDAFEEQLPEANDLLARAIRAGHGISAGFEMVAEEMSEPIATEFRRVYEEQRFGLPLEESLRDMAERVDLVDVKMLVTAILIQRESGGNLAELLDNISTTVRERFKLQRQVKVHTAQGRLTGYLLAALPIVLLLLITMLNAEYIAPLFEKQLGRLLLVSAALLQITGFFVIRRIIRIDI